MLNGVSEATANERILPAFNRHLDALWITHPDPAMIDGIHTALQTVSVEGGFWGLMGEGNSETRWLESDLRQLGTTSVMLEKSSSYDLEGVAFQVIDITDSVRAIEIRHGNFEFLIPDGFKQRESMQTNRNPTVLLLSPIDLSNSAPTEWLKLNPAIIVSALPTNSEAPNWISLLPGGSVEISTDGSTYRISEHH